MITEIESAEIAHAAITAGHARIEGGHPMLNAFAEELRAAIAVPHNGKEYCIPERSGLRTNGKKSSSLGEIKAKLEGVKPTKDEERKMAKEMRMELYHSQVKDRRPSINAHDVDEKAMEFPLTFAVDQQRLEKNEMLFAKLIGITID